MTTRRFYWLKLKEDFFRQKEIKKLRRIAGGDTFTIIYLKMLLRSLKDDGRLYFEGIEDDFASELALDIDEDEDNVRVTVAFLLQNNILVECKPDEFQILTAQEMTASECDSAERVRRFRDQRKQKALPCNATVTAGNAAETNSNVEIDIEKRDRDRDRDRDREVKRKRFNAPTVEEVEAYAKEKGWTESTFSPERFTDYYESKGWRVGNAPMKDWKAAARGWVSRRHQEQPQRREPQRNAALDYEQRDYSGMDESSFYTDLDALLAEGSE